MDTKDKVSPFMNADIQPGQIVKPTTGINLTFYDDMSGVKQQKVIFNTSASAPSVEEWNAIPYDTNDSARLDVTDIEGTYYIHYLVEDNDGNVDSDTIGAYEIDTKDPSIASIVSPSNGATEVEVAPQLKFTLSETTEKGNGYIYIKKASDNSVVSIIPVSNSAVHLDGTNVTVEPTTALENDTEYYVDMTSGCFIDGVGNELPAFNGATSWTFTTKEETQEIEQQEIKIIGIDVTQEIDDGKGGTENSTTKAQ